MHCLYCGKGFWLASKIVNDLDFCRPTHRWKFHKRLEAAVKVIDRVDEMHPAGTAGFRGEMATFDSTYNSSIAGPCLRVHAVAVPAFRLVAIGEQLPLESLNEITAEAAQPVARTNQADRHARLVRVSDMVTQLRRDVERRREDAARGNSGRVLARVIELKPGVQTPPAVRPSLRAELPLAIGLG